jgi:hypothetical protein
MPDTRAAPEPEARRAAVFLGELDRLLARRGIVEGDAPALFSERRAQAAALARGVADEAAARDLLERGRRVEIDRPFVEAKLERITREIGKARIAASVAEALRARARRALSHAVTGRYTEANAELNAIARMLKR